jgi:hypothetical protein
MADSANPTVPPPRLELTPTERAALALIIVTAIVKPVDAQDVRFTTPASRIR